MLDMKTERALLGGRRRCSRRCRKRGGRAVGKEMNKNEVI